MKEKIAEIVKRIQLGLCPENRHYDCNVCTYSCSECWTKTIEALIEQENAGMREALVTARGIAMEQEEDWIAVERMYLPERIIPFRDIQVVLDAVLGGSHE